MELKNVKVKQYSFIVTINARDVFFNLTFDVPGHWTLRIQSDATITAYDLLNIVVQIFEDDTLNISSLYIDQKSEFFRGIMISKTETNQIEDYYTHFLKSFMFKKV